MLKRSTALATLLGVALLVGRGPAWAQDAPDYAAAKRHYLGAREAAGKGDYDGAVKEYIAAYNITKDPVLFKSIAASYEAKGNKEEAAIYYRRYLKEVANPQDADDVRKRIAVLEASGAPATAPAPVEPTPPVKPPEPTPTPTPALTPPTPEETPSLKDEGSRWGRTAGWISVGAAAVLLTTGSVLATSALSRKEDLDRLVEFRDENGLPKAFSGNVKDDYNDKLDEGDSLNTLSLVAFIGAGSFAVLATVFFIIDASSGSEEESAGAKVSQHLTPFVGPNTAGISAGWEF